MERTTGVKAGKARDVAHGRRRIIIGTALAAVASASLLFWWYARPSSQDGPRPFRYLPPSCVIAVHLDLAGLRNSSLVRQALDSLARPQLEKDYAEFVRATGFDFERDLDSVSLGISGPEGARAVHAVLQGRFDRDKIDRYSSERRQATRTHLGHAINQFAGSSGGKFRLAFLGSSGLAFSNAPDASLIEQMIELAERGAPALGNRLRELHVFERLPAGTQAWVAVDLERAGRWKVPAGPASSGTSLSAELLRGSRMGLVAARVGEREVELRMVAECFSGGQAQRVAQSLSGLRALLAALAEREGPQDAQLARSLQQISIGVEKNAAVVRWRLQTALLERMLRESASPRL